MINLLPLEERNSFVKERKLKLAVIFEVGFLLFLISLVFVLLAGKLYLRGEIESQRTFLSQREKEASFKTVEDFQKSLEAYNSKLQGISSFYGQQTFLTDVMQKLSSLLPPGCHLTSFSFRLKSDKSGQNMVGGTVSLTGFAPTRESLLSFKENLEEEKSFEKVVFPPIDWAEPLNIDFSLTFELKR
jgi:Tfp pilus assembly protein PilN